MGGDWHGYVDRLDNPGNIAGVRADAKVQVVLRQKLSFCMQPHHRKGKRSKIKMFNLLVEHVIVVSVDIRD